MSSYDRRVLQFREIESHPALAPFVKSFWTLSGSGLHAPTERLLPDGSFDLVFHIGEPFVRGVERQPRAMWVGEIRHPVLITPSPRVDVLGLRFRIGGTAPFVGVPMKELRDSILPLDDVLRGFGERVLNGRTTEERITIIETFLLRALRNGAPVSAGVFGSRTTFLDRRVGAAVREIVRSDGDVRIGDLAARIGTTPRTLERLFRDQVGVGPKSLARLVRFQIAVRGGDAAYFDDAHRAHEFRALSGVTPSEFRRERNLMNDAFVGNLQDAAEL